MKLRALRIGWIGLRYRLDRLLPASLPLPWWLAPLGWLPAPRGPAAPSLRQALEELGPIFVKFGQLLSTRRDLLPDDYADELAKLQDQVTPFDPLEARALIEQALGAPIDQLFERFDNTPLASASVAQVHSAKLRAGEEVVVKVLRPRIRGIIEQDISLLMMIAALIENRWADAHRLHPVRIVEDYRSTILKELDLRLEASNASRLRRNFEGLSELYVPRVHFELCRENVLVMERIHGVPVDDLARLRAAGVNLRKLAHLGVQIFFTQVFEHNFFHADMHPGNVFVAWDEPENPRYIALDCAIFGSLSESDKDYLARNLIAFFNRDYLQVAQLHVDSGWVPADTDVHAFESVIRSVCEPLFEKPISEISFGHVVVNLFQTARMFNMEVQPQLILLQKTLLNIEGLGRQVYPQLNLWDTAKPFLEQWMRQRLGPTAGLKEMARQFPRIASRLPALPGLVLDAMTELSRLGDHQRHQRESIQRLRQEIASGRKGESSGRRFATGALVLAMLLAAMGDSLAWERIPVASWLLGGLALGWLLAKG